MMCQEVIELMQRYLDRDLDETEYRRMLLHLENCPDCTELFERLVNVSQELESLPKVLPPFSLVDAILPKLEELEAQGVDAAERGLAAGAEKTAAAPPAPEEVRPAPRPERGSWRKNVREWVSFPVFGGVVAAGLVLGFFLFGQGQPGQDADKLLSGLAGGSSKESASSAPAAAGTAAQNAPGGSADQNGAGEQPKADLVNPPAKKELAPPADGANTNAGGTAPKEPAPRAGGAAKSAPPAVQSEQPPAAKQTQPDPIASAQNPAAPPLKAEEPGDGQGAASVPPAGADAAKGAAASEPAAPESTPPADNGAQASEEQPSSEPVDTFRAAESGGSGENGTGQSLKAPDAKKAIPQTPSASGEGTSFAGISSIRPAEPVHKLAAEGGAYAAAVIDGKVQIQDKDGKTVFTSMDWSDADRVDLKQWSGDKLTYHVEMETGGQIRCFIVDAKAGTETEGKKTP
ncbi:zf-HC2 domain-containing protein [Paenibacillus sp. S-38]|uniref:anti-sigma factor family protein n=1 Tax=Paenibacillus sp. S-38 TaxID=3416710 RepID=UPI003CF01F79